MKAIWAFIKQLYSGPFQAALVISFTLVAAITIGVSTWVITETISSYLAGAMDERVAQDMLTAEIFYQFQVEELASSANQLALSRTVQDSFLDACRGESEAILGLESKIQTSLIDGILEGNRAAVMLDDRGRMIAGVLKIPGQTQILLQPGASWTGFPIYDAVLASGSLISSTEVIPVQVLLDTGLADQARIALQDTPRAAPELFDPREGSAGLGIVGAAPIRLDGRIAGAVVIFHLLNNDFSLVDAIKETARIDTATIFFGDLRVSTNVRAESGERAVGTRVSQDVRQVVLEGGEEYVGPAFVVNENYITRYEPLRDHQGGIVGMIYVGARQADFLEFLHTFQSRISLLAGITVLVTFLIATPVSRIITRPLQDLRTLSHTSRLVAEGDPNARAPISAGGEVGQLAASFNDMLDRLQEAQKQLVQSEKLASLGQLAAGVAHELNNPLATVLLFAEILLRNKDLDQTLRTDLQTIVRETGRCKKIVSSLLDFARQHQVEASEVDLNQLVQRVISLEGKQPRYQGLQIDFDPDQALPPIQADEVQLQAVIGNLMSNAADAMPRGGVLALRTRRLDSNQVLLEVEDQGEGIPPAHQARLFTPFFTTKAPGEGTGLGLSIVYGIVKMHSGQISVQSRIGEGTTFRVQLPVRQPDRTLLERQEDNPAGENPLIG